MIVPSVVNHSILNIVLKALAQKQWHLYQYLIFAEMWISKLDSFRETFGELDAHPLGNFLMSLDPRPFVSLSRWLCPGLWCPTETLHIALQSAFAPQACGEWIMARQWWEIPTRGQWWSMYHESWGSHGGPDCFVLHCCKKCQEVLFTMCISDQITMAERWMVRFAIRSSDISRHLIQPSKLDLLHPVTIDEALEQLQKCAKRCDQGDHAARNLGYFDRKLMWIVRAEGLDHIWNLLCFHDLFSSCVQFHFTASFQTKAAL